ncbi:TPR-like protein [Pisolithus microcarpus]|nr:TPR-like protein [Pisolithus microcarpus]
MVSESAKLAKEKGNEAFKAGDYPTAIGHYTTAILADGNDPTFYLNRAAAYLKLGKDSTKGNIDGARQDFNEALRLEPSNISALREMKAKPVPRRRRVPIEIIEPEADKPPAMKDEPLLQPVSSRHLRPETTQETKEQLPLQRRATQTPTPVRPPMTLFDFTKSWNSLETDEARWKLMCTIPPSSLPALFQASLEPDLLKSILHTFQAVCSPFTSSAVRDYLTALMRVQRFETLMLFMDKREQQRLESLRQQVESL